MKPPLFKLQICIASFAFSISFWLGSAKAAIPSPVPLDTPISLQFTDIELSELLQILAKIGGANFLLSESIKGTISVDLTNTPWQTALHSIIASRGLRLARNGDIYWIGPH